MKLEVSLYHGRGYFFCRAVILLLIVINLGFIWFNSSQTADESNKRSKSIAHSIAPYAVSEYKDMPKSDKSTAESKLNNRLRTFAHAAEFVPLGILLFLLITAVFDFKNSNRAAVILCCVVCVMLLAFLFALGDEIHQLFVDKRAFEWSDIRNDCIGSASGLAVCLAVCETVRAIKSKSIKRSN